MEIRVLKGHGFTYVAHMNIVHMGLQILQDLKQQNNNNNLSNHQRHFRITTGRAHKCKEMCWRWVKFISIDGLSRHLRSSFKQGTVCCGPERAVQLLHRTSRPFPAALQEQGLVTVKCCSSVSAGTRGCCCSRNWEGKAALKTRSLHASES